MPKPIDFDTPSLSTAEVEDFIASLDHNDLRDYHVEIRITDGRRAVFLDGVEAIDSPALLKQALRYLAERGHEVEWRADELVLSGWYWYREGGRPREVIKVDVADGGVTLWRVGVADPVPQSALTGIVEGPIRGQAPSMFMWRE